MCLAFRETQRSEELLIAAQQCGVVLPEMFVAKMAYSLAYAEKEAQRGRLGWKQNETDHGPKPRSRGCLQDHSSRALEAMRAPNGQPKRQGPLRLGMDTSPNRWDRNHLRRRVLLPKPHRLHHTPPRHLRQHNRQNYHKRQCVPKPHQSHHDLHRARSHTGAPVEEEENQPVIHAGLCGEYYIIFVGYG